MSYPKVFRVIPQFLEALRHCDAVLFPLSRAEHDLAEVPHPANHWHICQLFLNNSFWTLEKLIIWLMSTTLASNPDGLNLSGQRFMVTIFFVFCFPLLPREHRISRSGSRHTGSLSQSYGWGPLWHSRFDTKGTSWGLCTVCTQSRTTSPRELPLLRREKTIC